MKITTPIVLLVLTSVVQVARAGEPFVIEQRLMTISIERCEVATFLNVQRVMRPDVVPEVNAETELRDLSHGFLVSARVSGMRRLRWPVGLVSTTRFDELVPEVGTWEIVPKGDSIDLLYFSAQKSCVELRRHTTSVVVSTDNADCDTTPPYGWCIVDARRVVADLPAKLKQYSRRHWWQRR